MNTHHRLMLAPLGLVVVWSLLGSSLRADEWIYRRSYYSHAPVDGAQPQHPLPEHRSAYRPAYYREAQGFSVRSAYRINNYVLRNGPRSDHTIYQEGYIEFNP